MRCFFFQAEDGIRDADVTGVQTCALPISLAALQFSRSLSDDVTAVVVDVDAAATTRLRDSWEAWGIDIPLVVLESPYRSVARPLLAYLEATDRREPERGTAVVILPE